ncbi:MAG: endolytic transglycosylase MltG [Oscillospiraceae bacterium]|jgi:UPF0755 protein|nr:endolytic transglycosylase MltG [Oscillospiraceae bacterium]
MSGDREDIIRSIEEALKFVDNSDLPPAPASIRPVIERAELVYNPLPEIVEEDIIAIPVTPNKKPKTRSYFSEMKLRRKMKKKSAQPSEDIENEEEFGSADFKMKFDFESEYRDVPNNRPLRQRRERRTGLVGGLMFMIFIICIAMIFASIAWLATVDILGFASVDELVHVTVPYEFDLDDIIDLLYEAGLIRYKALFRLYAEYSEAESKIAPGSYVLNRNFDYRALVQGMTARAGIRVEVSVTIPEGFTLSQIFRRLEDEGVCAAEDLWYTATHHNFNFYFLDESTLGDRLRLEGFLFPDTYNFFLDSTPTQVISRMLREFDRRFTEQYIERATHLGYTVREIVIIASMIEREAGNDEERSRIAAVIYNRLNSPNFPRLEIDATIHYAIADTGIPFSIALDSPFNTYIHDGLPPGPIANPGIASIRAALYPANTNEFFYALNRHGTHNFFTNFTDHNNFVNSPDYGG